MACCMQHRAWTLWVGPSRNARRRTASASQTRRVKTRNAPARAVISPITHEPPPRFMSNVSVLVHTLTLVYSPSSRGSGARLSAPPARSSINSASALSSLSLSRMRLRRPLEAAAAAHDDVVGALRALLVRQHLDGQRRGNGRLWRRLARAPEAVAGRPVGRPLPGSAELPRAARRTLRRCRSRAGALPLWGGL